MDNIAMIEKILKSEDDLMDNKDDMISVANFFNSQFAIFDDADKVYRQMQKEMDFYRNNKEAKNAFKFIGQILNTEGDNYNYNKIH